MRKEDIYSHLAPFLELEPESVKRKKMIQQKGDKNNFLTPEFQIKLHQVALTNNKWGHIMQNNFDLKSSHIPNLRFRKRLWSLGQI